MQGEIIGCLELFPEKESMARVRLVRQKKKGKVMVKGSRVYDSLECGCGFVGDWNVDVSV